MEPETLYRQIGRLIETVPEFVACGNLTSDQLQWLGRARALVKETGDIALMAAIGNLTTAMHSPIRLEAFQQILHTLYDALAIAELRAPPSERGAFIPAGNKFEAFAAINRMLQSATSDVLIVDPTWMRPFSLSSGAASLRVCHFDFSGMAPTLAHL